MDRFRHLTTTLLLTLLTATNAFMENLLLDILNGKPLASLEEAARLLPASNTAALQLLVEEGLRRAKDLKKNLLALEPANRNYQNTVQAYDTFCALMSMVGATAQLAKSVSTDAQNRTAPYEYYQKEALALSADKAFYQAFCDYQNHAGRTEPLNKEEHYFLTETVKDFIRAGYDKNEEEFATITTLREAIHAAESQFDTLINNDTSSIIINEAALTGVAPAFVAAQQRTQQGLVELFCNYPTRSAIMPHCTNAEVRKALDKAFNRRAFPANKEVLGRLLTLRTQLAQALGHTDYASHALEATLIGSPESAAAFIHTMASTVAAIEKKDTEMLRGTLPADVILTETGMLQPWDLAYACAAYKKNKLDLDPRAVAEYFPVEKTIEGIFAIYEKFMGVSFSYDKQVPNAWHESVSAITVYTQDRSTVLGYIFMDLFPRPQKFSHACCGGVVARTERTAADGSLIKTPYVGYVIANFPTAHQDAPALLLHSDVTTFFHEFGHAMHGVLSCTQHATTSGTRVLSDFVELPSQILEEWMYNPAMLRLVSSHYKTGDPLPDEIIARIQQGRTLGKGLQEASQNFYGLFSLEIHRSAEPVDLDAALHAAHAATITQTAFDDTNKMYASFGHLSDYGPTYYGYALSRAYAYDVFKRIEEVGLLDGGIGAHFVNCILKPGGSKHPTELLEAFLGRPASADAYLNSLKSAS